MEKTLLIGGLLGLLSGFFGLGGSSVATPLFREVLRLSPLLALGTPLPVIIPGSLIAAVTYARAGCVNARVGLWTLSAALPAALVGSVLSSEVPGGDLMIATGALVAAVGAVFFVQPWVRGRRPERPVQRQPPAPPRAKIALIGVGVGLLSGLLANGGGILLVPAYILALRLSTKEAFGTSLLVVLGTSIPTSFVHAWLGHVEFSLVLPLSLAMAPMAYVGARLTLATPAARIRQLYGLALVGLAIFFVASELRA